MSVYSNLASVESAAAFAFLPIPAPFVRSMLDDTAGLVAVELIPADVYLNVTFISSFCRSSSVDTPDISYVPAAPTAVSTLAAVYFKVIVPVLGLATLTVVS